MPEKSASAMKASGLYFPVTKTYLEGKRTEYGKEKSVRPFFLKWRVTNLTPLSPFLPWGFCESKSFEL